MGDRIYPSAQRCPGAKFVGDRMLCCLVPQLCVWLHVCCGCRASCKLSEAAGGGNAEI